MASFNNYYHQDYPPRPHPQASPNYARERFNSGSSPSAGGTAVPPSAGHSPPAAPNRAPVNRPHTTQPYGGYVPPQGFPPVPGQRSSIYGHYPGYAPPYGGVYPPPPAPPISYAESLQAPPLPVPAGALVPGKPPQGNESEPADDPFEKQQSPSNALAPGHTDEGVSGLGNQPPDLKGLPAEERDKLIGELWGRLQQARVAPKYPPYAPPPGYPSNPYYPLPPYYPQHAGYPPPMPPPLPHEPYPYPPPSAQVAMASDQERYSEEPEEKEPGHGPRPGAAPIMPGGYTNSPSAETPPPPPPAQPTTKLSRPSTPPKQSTTPVSTSTPAPPFPPTAAQTKKADVGSRSGFPPPPPKPRTIPTPAPEEQAKPMRMPSTRKGEKEKPKDMGSPSSTGPNPVGPNGQGEIGVIGQMWGVYLFDHDNMNGRLPTPRPKLRSLLRAVANWIIKDIEPKDSLVIPPDKLIKFYQASQVDDEPFPSGWQDFITSLPPANLSELFQKLECHHFLVPPPPRSVLQTKEKPNKGVDAYTSYDPIIPALTPIGFEHWMLIQLVAFPDREARRLQKIITEIPLNDGDNQRFPKFLPRACLPIGGDGQVGEWWDETVMSCRKGGYLSNGLDEDDDEDGGYSSEIIHGREPRPYAKSNVASSRGSSRERIEEERRKEREDHLYHQSHHHNHHHDEEQEFVPPALLRKKTDQKYASTQIAFDDLREDPSKQAEIERKRKPYVSVPPTKGARDVLHASNGGGATNISAGTRLGGFGDRDLRDKERDRPGSHDTNGSGTSGGRPGGGGVELHPGAGASSIAGSTATTKAGDYGGVKVPSGHSRGPSIAEDGYNNFKRFGSTSTSTGPTTPGSAHPPSTFSSPQTRTTTTNAAAAGGQYTPISPINSSHPELHHYPSVYPHIRGTRLSNIIPPPPPPADLSPPDVTPPPLRPGRRRASISAADAVAEYFGGALPDVGGAGNGPRAGGAGGDYNNHDRLEYLPRGQHQQPPHGYHPHSAHPHHSHHHGGFYRRDQDRDLWDDDDEMFYRGGPDRDRDRREGGYRRDRDRERDRERDRGRRSGDVDEQEDVVPPPRRRAGRSRPPSEFRDGPGVVGGGGSGGGVGGWGR